MKKLQEYSFKEKQNYSTNKMSQNDFLILGLKILFYLLKKDNEKMFEKILSDINNE